jgi:hypothetical protein
MATQVLADSGLMTWREIFRKNISSLSVIMPWLLFACDLLIKTMHGTAVTFFAHPYVQQEGLIWCSDMDIHLKREASQTLSRDLTGVWRPAPNIRICRAKELQ